MNEMKVMKSFNDRLEKMEKMMKKLLDIEEENIDSDSNSNSNSDYSPSSESEDSIEFKEFLDEDIWEVNKNENKECNECGSVDIEKDPDCEGDQYVFWCNECNCHVGASVNEEDVDCEPFQQILQFEMVKNSEYEDDIEWCDECEYFVCKCNEIENCEICEIYLKRKRKIEEIESDTEDNIKVDSKRMRN